MKAAEVIVRMAATAPALSNVGVRLMLHVIATAIVTGSDVVRITSRGAAASIGRSEDGMKRGVRDLSRFIEADVRDRQFTLFQLGSDWYEAQMHLDFGGETCEFPQPCLGKPGTTAWESQARLPGKARHDCLGKPGTLPGEARQDCGNSAVPAWESQARCLGKPGTEADAPIRNACARVDRSIDPILGDMEMSARIERAVQTVKILPTQVEDAEILRGALIDYRDDFPDKSRLNVVPDDVVIAHILAIGEPEELCRVLRTLQNARVAPQPSDMWFFFVLMDKVLGAPRELVRERMDAQKAKARSHKSQPSLFGPNLVSATSAAMRKLA